MRRRSLAIEDIPEEPPPLALATPLPAQPPATAAAPGTISTTKWGDWRWQMKNRLRSTEQFRAMFPDFKASRHISEAAEKFPMAITPYYASLIREFNESDPVFQMSIPRHEELIDPHFLHDDPLEEDKDMPVPNLVHRYADRALLIATSICAMYCRHCTRKRVAGQRESSISQANLELITEYIASHPEIRDVIISGGDPFTMSTSALERIILAVRSVPSVETIRIGTRTPVTVPMRVTDKLASMLKKYHPIWVNTHFNHPVELTPEARAACARLVNAGIPVGNQTVLLRGINDDPLVLEELFRGLVRNRVRPYYLFQCDLVKAVEHFRTPLSKGIEIMEYLRGRLSGIAIPSFVVDTPGGGGKIPLLPNYVVSTSPTHTVLRNYEGMLVAYPEPAVQGFTGHRPPHNNHENTSTVYDLAAGRMSKIQPSCGTRIERRANITLCDMEGRGNP